MTEKNTQSAAAAEKDPQKDAAIAKAGADATKEKKTAAPALAQGAPQQPTVSRIVHYIDKRRFKDEPCAALITQVHSDKTVNLFVWLPDGKTEVKQGVAQAPKDPKDEASNVWTWPARS